MSADDLPFDAEEMLTGLRPWIECESPTWDAAAVSRMMDLAARDLSAIGATVETVPGTKGFGTSGSAPHLPHDQASRILVLGHMDTVHPLGTLEKLPFRVQDGKAWGPGIMDMKGGNYVFLEARQDRAGFLG